MPSSTLDDRERPRDPQAAGDAARRHAHVHELRLVLRRDQRVSKRCRCFQYAGRAIQLGEELIGDDFETTVPRTARQGAEQLARARRRRGRSTSSACGRREIGWEQIGAHYAVWSLFEKYAAAGAVSTATPPSARRISRESPAAAQAGRRPGAHPSEVTQESRVVSFGVLHFGDHNVNGGVNGLPSDEALRRVLAQDSPTRSAGDFAEVIRLMDRDFGESTYSLASLFRDEQRKVIKQLLTPSIVEAETAYRRLYEQHLPTMRFLARHRTAAASRLPDDRRIPAQHRPALGRRKTRSLNLEHIRSLLARQSTWHVASTPRGLATSSRRTVGAAWRSGWREHPATGRCCSRLKRRRTRRDVPVRDRSMARAERLLRAGRDCLSRHAAVGRGGRSDGGGLAGSVSEPGSETGGSAWQRCNNN